MKSALLKRRNTTDGSLRAREDNSVERHLAMFGDSDRGLSRPQFKRSWRVYILLSELNLGELGHELGCRA